MKEITSTADNVRRQVVPADFSFLSQADTDVVRGVGLILGAMFGLGERDALSLGVTVTRQQVGDQWHYGLSDGVVLLGGSFYEVRGVRMVAFDHYLSKAEMDAFASDYYLIFGERTVSPSPVYKYGEGTVSCHVQTCVTEISQQPDANTVRIADLRTLPTVGNLGYVWRVV